MLASQIDHPSDLWTRHVSPENAARIGSCNESITAVLKGYVEISYVEEYLCNNSPKFAEAIEQGMPARRSIRLVSGLGILATDSLLMGEAVVDVEEVLAPAGGFPLCFAAGFGGT